MRKWIFIIVILISHGAQAQIATGAHGFTEGYVQAHSLKAWQDDLTLMCNSESEFGSNDINWSANALSGIVRWSFLGEAEVVLEFSGNFTGKVTDYLIDEDTGDIYVVGTISNPSEGEFLIGNTNLSSSGFIALISQDGNEIWSKDLSGFLPVRILGVNEAIVVGGHLESCLTFADSSFCSISDDPDLPYNAGVLKIGDDGGEEWAVVLAGETREIIQDISSDSQGNVYACGYSLSSEFEFAGEAHLPGAYVARIDEDGTPQWIDVKLYEDEIYLGNTKANSIEVNSFDEPIVLFNTEADSFPTSLETTQFECGLFTTNREVLVKYNSVGIELAVQNIGCRQNSESDGHFILVNDDVLVSTHIRDYAHFEEFEVPADGESESMILRLSPSLDPVSIVFSTSPDANNIARISIAELNGKIYWATLFSEELTFQDFSLVADSPRGCVFEFDLDVGITEVRDSEINLYPNPCQSSLCIDLGSAQIVDAWVKIYTTTGNLVYQTQMNLERGILDIDVNPLHQGVYHLNIRAGARICHTSFLKY